MKTFHLKIICVFITLIILGCANPFKQFYYDNLGGKPITDFPVLEPHEGEPEFFSGSDIDTDSQAMKENGYIMIGFSSFNSGVVSPQNAIQHAKSIQAAVVIFYSQYTNTETGNIPYTVYNPPQPVTTYQSGSVYGAGGYGYYSGSSTAWIPGSSTTHYIPYSINRYNYAASYWVKAKPPIFGVHCVEIPDNVRHQIERNTGGFVDTVVKGSPAFNANILRGDVLIQMAGEPIDNCQAFIDLIARNEGKEIQVDVIRGKENRSMKLKLRQKAY